MYTPGKDLRKQVGKQGELYASEHLLNNSYTLLEKNWKCRTGEIDLIAEKDGVIIFVEVRSRMHSARFGTAKESVNYRKQNQIRETAQVFIYRKKIHDVIIRFDVIAVLLNIDGTMIELEHIDHAF